MTTPLTVTNQDLLASILRNGPLPCGSATPEQTAALWAMANQGYTMIEATAGRSVWALTTAGSAAAQMVPGT